MSPVRVDERRRVLLMGASELSRRLRMSMKVVAELRRRGWRFSAVVCGDVPEEFRRVVPPDEIHTQLTEEELSSLFATSSVLLETADDPALVSAALDSAVAAGVPIVCHAGAAPNRGTVITVSEWSADAFADALISGN